MRNDHKKRIYKIIMKFPRIYNYKKRNEYFAALKHFFRDMTLIIAHFLCTLKSYKTR